MRRLSLLDNVFLQIESLKTPMHVAGLMVFQPPAGSPDFAARLVPRLREPVRCAPPFGERLRPAPLSLLPGAWENARGFVPGAHVHEAWCPSPGGTRELETLVADLHGPLLERTRPMWSCHVVHRLHGDRFAIYCKVHHAAVDGVSGLRRMQNSLSRAPDEPTAPLWAMPPAPSRRGARPPRLAPAELVSGLRAYLRGRRDDPRAMPGLYAAPATSLNRPLTPRRTLRTLSLDLDGVRAVARAADATVNDVALAVVAGALRRYLRARGELPAAPLVAFVPVSLHDETSKDLPSNRVCNVLVALPTHLAGASARLRWIHEAMARAKQLVRSLSPAACTAMSLLLGTPTLLGELLGLTPHLPLPFNVVVSNVAGPRQPLYLSGARLEAVYPVSALFERQGANITFVSYEGHLCIGALGCPDTCDVDDLAAALTASWETLAGPSGTETGGRMAAQPRASRSAARRDIRA
jgi:WS/DGAT/MGAT family acyltransferase